MKVAVYILIILLTMGCSTISTKVDFKENLKNEKNNVQVSVNGQTLFLTWDNVYTRKYSFMEIYRKMDEDNKYVLEYKAFNNEYTTNIPLFGITEYKVVGVTKDEKREDLESVKVCSKVKNIILEEIDGRKCQVYIPATYKENNKRYPVVYMLDGHEVFDNFPRKSWQVNNVLERLVENGKCEEMIVVAIHNAGLLNLRAQEYVPYVDDNIRINYDYKESKVNEFTNFLIEKVVKNIDQKYRTIPNRDNRVIMGASYGGLYSLWIGANHSNIFSVVGAMSPTIEVADFKIAEEYLKRDKMDLKIWIDIGTNEKYDYNSRRLVDKLIGKGYKYGRDIFYYEDRDAMHLPEFWANRVENVLIMFKGKTSDKIIDIQLIPEVSIYEGKKGKKERLIINPVALLENGMRYSLYKFANYKITETNNGEIDLEGEYKFKNKNNIEIEVNYENFKKNILIDYKTIKEEIRRLKL